MIFHVDRNTHIHVVQNGWSDVVEQVEQVLTDVEDSVKDRQRKPGECPFQVPSLLYPLLQRSVVCAVYYRPLFKFFGLIVIYYLCASSLLSFC